MVASEEPYEPSCFSLVGVLEQKLEFVPSQQLGLISGSDTLMLLKEFRVFFAQKSLEKRQKSSAAGNLSAVDLMCV